MNEAQLLRKACQGDGPAVRALYERYSPRVYAFVRRIAADDDLAQDYAQEAWIRAIPCASDVSGRGPVRYVASPHRGKLGPAGGPEGGDAAQERGADA